RPRLTPVAGWGQPPPALPAPLAHRQRASQPHPRPAPAGATKDLSHPEPVEGRTTRMQLAHTAGGRPALPFPLITPPPPVRLGRRLSGPLRLEAQDTALSRRQHRFESGRGRQTSQRPAYRAISAACGKGSPAFPTRFPHTLRPV